MSRHTGTGTEQMLRRTLDQRDSQIEAEKRAFDKMAKELAEEKALADRLWVALRYFGALRNGDFEKSDVAAAYRKARGL